MYFALPLTKTAANWGGSVTLGTRSKWDRWGYNLPRCSSTSLMFNPCRFNLFWKKPLSLAKCIDGNCFAQRIPPPKKKPSARPDFVTKSRRIMEASSCSYTLEIKISNMIVWKRHFASVVGCGWLWPFPQSCCDTP